MLAAKMVPMIAPLRAVTHSLLAGPALCLALSVAPAPALAQRAQPWTPATTDSVTRFVASARVRFQEQAGDSLTGRDVQAFELVANGARRLLRRLGRSQMAFAPSVESTLDSLGADVDVVVDPAQPSIAFVLVRNPYRPASGAVGYLMWYRGDDLRMQGISFPAGIKPRLRAWYTGRTSGPYAAAVVYTRREPEARFGFKFLRLSPEGFVWNLVQYEGHGPELGAGGDVAFIDINQDGAPEMIHTQRVEPDSFLVLERGTPQLMQEHVFTERPEGFVPHDARVLPGPIATLRLFALTLMANDREGTARLIADRSRLDEAYATGWGRTRVRGAWTVEYGEERQPWPEWLALKVHGDGGPRRWIFHFVIRDGRWVIRDWKPVVVGRNPASGG